MKSLHLSITIEYTRMLGKGSELLIRKLAKPSQCWNCCLSHFSPNFDFVTGKGCGHMPSHMNKNGGASGVKLDYLCFPALDAKPAYQSLGLKVS